MPLWTASPATEEGENSKSELRALFDSLDVNGDGRVSSKEWGAAVARNRSLAAKYFGGASMREIGAAFSRIDVDGRRAAVSASGRVRPEWGPSKTIRGIAAQRKSGSAWGEELAARSAVSWRILLFHP